MNYIRSKIRLNFLSCRYLQERYFSIDFSEKFKLNKKFLLNEAWLSRISELKKDGFEGSYEWITILQKKFASTGKASAVDIDIAVNLSGEEDQIKDLIDIIYRLRHTSNAGDLLPSTEYAMFRLLMKYNNWDILFELINDSINYGVFLNEHASCLAIDFLLNQKNISGAAKIASYVMQQEMFDCNLLNYLSLYSLLMWIGLPAEKRIFDQKIQPIQSSNSDFNDDEIKTFKFPYLKNDFFDNHFDLINANSLVRKSLNWFSKNLPTEIDKNKKNELIIQIKKLLSSTEPETVPFILNEKNLNLIFNLINELYKPILLTAEDTLLNTQLNLFNVWNNNRRKLISAQAERINLTFRKEEIKRRKEELKEEEKILFFFDNRIYWEDEARQKDNLFEELQLLKKEEEETEKEYAENLFENARRVVQGKYNLQKNKITVESKK